MLARDLYLKYQNQADDLKSKAEVSPELFLNLLSEAQEEACVRSNLIFDKTSSFCTISVTEDKTVYELDDSIYAIAYASITDASSTVTKLAVVDRIETDRLDPEWRTKKDQPKRVIHYDTYVELTPIPNAVYTLNLECYLLPDDILNENQEPQISRAHHKNLIHWVLYRAYSTRDNDLYNPEKALDYLGKFERIFGKRPAANRSRNKYSNRPNRNKVTI